jgi:hypothetical protein
MTSETQQMIDAVQEDPRYLEKQIQTEVDTGMPGIGVRVWSGIQTTMIGMIEHRGVTVEAIRVIRRGFDTWTSVDDWDGETITGVRGITHMPILYRLLENDRSRTYTEIVEENTDCAPMEK